MSRLKDLPPRVTGVLWLGVIMFWAVQLSLYVLAGLPLSDTILLATLLIAMPALAVAQVPLTAERRIERLPAYWSSIATLWILGTISWLVGTRTDGLAAIGVTLLAPAPFTAWTLGLTAAGKMIIVHINFHKFSNQRKFFFKEPEFFLLNKTIIRVALSNRTKLGLPKECSNILQLIKSYSICKRHYILS